MLHIGKRLAGLMIVAVVQLVGLCPHQRTVRLAGIDATLIVHQPRLAKEVAGIELDVEAHLA